MTSFEQNAGHHVLAMLEDEMGDATASSVSASCSTAGRLILPFSEWPENDRACWKKALAGEGPLGLDNPAANWSEATVMKNREGYGRYLSWLMRNELLKNSEAPGDRIRPDRFKAYISEERLRVAPASVGTYAAALCASAIAFAPKADWDWLRQRTTRIRKRAKPVREKQETVRDSFELYNLGMEIMDEARSSTRSPLRMAIRFEIGLIIALLALRPLRMRNFQSLTIGSSLRYERGEYWLSFSRSETKTGRAINKQFPVSLVPHLERYLKLYRPQILSLKGRTAEARQHKRLWIDQYGGPMQMPALRFNIESATKAAFGRAVWPHLFRDCAFTTLAVHNPDLIAIGSGLLDHLSPKTGENHYNQATMLQASDEYTKTIIGQRTVFINEILAAQAEETDRRMQRLG